jgi:tyrosyl-DNA phosphodiesterase 2
MFSHLRSQIDSWRWKTPVPGSPSSKGTRPIFQKWHHFDESCWLPLVGDARASGTKHNWGVTLNLISWNVNADAPLPGLRMLALLRVIQTAASADILFFQEVSKEALATLLSDPWIQQHWQSTEADNSHFGKQFFATITLISKSCVATRSISLGSVWRVPLPSRFGRDALCCDLLINPSSPRPTRLRLINVHLDSLPINPSLRPDQLSIIASYLFAADHGLVAGDFNPVLPEDDSIISDNGLVDAWTHLHPKNPGFTWGADGDKPFPPNRLDKVALCDLAPTSMRILPPCFLDDRKTGNINIDNEPDLQKHLSDHAGLLCRFSWTGTHP